MRERTPALARTAATGAATSRRRRVIMADTSRSGASGFDGGSGLPGAQGGDGGIEPALATRPADDAHRLEQAGRMGAPGHGDANRHEEAARLQAEIGGEGAETRFGRFLVIEI